MLHVRDGTSSRNALVPTPLLAALSRVFRACSRGNLGGPLLLPGPSGTPVLAALLTDGFACSDDPYVVSPNGPGLFEWLPQHATWLQQQLAALA